MAIRADSEELKVARFRLDAARQKMEGHVGTGNLTRSGREKPIVGREAPARGERSVQFKDGFESGHVKSSQQVDREVTGIDTLAQGKTRGKAYSQVAPPPLTKKTEALKLGPTLTVPMTRDARPANADGATSFHFLHEAIAKGRGEKTSARGTKTRKGSAQEHAKYLERDSAVARIGDAIENAPALAESDERRSAIGAAAAGGLYIEREEALAHQENGVPVIYSNISQDAAERQRFWEDVEEHETEPAPDYLVITTSQDREFWQDVQADPRCPPALAQAIVEADPDTPSRITTGDNEPVREMMTDHGWAPPSPRNPYETEQEKLQRHELDLHNSKGATWVDGRGGHIQNRIVGELPYEVDHESRARIVRRFADFFEKKNLPYVAVMHAPDFKNNDKNWHFHLAYYERPCSRFSGAYNDYILENFVAKNARDQGMHDVKANALASGELDRFAGQWDLTVPVTYKSKCGHMRTTSPFFQDKDRDCNKRGFPLKLRKLLAQFTNDELEAAEVGRRVDPRRYNEMGINKEAEEHLGSRSAQLEILGIPTPRGITNEAKQWQSILNRIERELQAANKAVDNQERRWGQDLDLGELAPSHKNEVSKLITFWGIAKTEANEQRAIGDEFTQQYGRARSRAEKVLKTCGKHIAAIDGGRASSREKNNRGLYAERLLEATEHLGGLRILMAPEIAQAKACNERSLKLEDDAIALEQRIVHWLKEGLCRAMRGLGTQDKAKGEGEDGHEVGPTGGLALGLAGDAEPHEGAGSQAPTGHTLSLDEFDRFAKDLREDNRRLIRRGKTIVPVAPTNDEMFVITAINFADFQPRMLKLKQAQDNFIARIQAYLTSYPGSLRIAKLKGPDSKSIYELLVGDRGLQHAFKSCQSDPLVANAIVTALEAQRKVSQAAGPEAATARNGAPQAARLGQLDQGAATDHVPDSDTAARRLATSPGLIMRRIDDVARMVTPIIEIIYPRGTHYHLDDAALQFHGINAGELRLENVQRRLAGIFREQQREIGRLVGFAKRHPARMIFGASHSSGAAPPRAELSQTAPQALRSLAAKYADHPAAQQQLAKAVHEALQDPSATDRPTPGMASLQTSPKAMDKVAQNDTRMGDTVGGATDAAEPSSKPSLRVASDKTTKAESKIEISAQIETSPTSLTHPNAVPNLNLPDGERTDLTEQRDVAAKDDEINNGSSHMSEPNKSHVGATHNVSSAATQSSLPDQTNSGSKSAAPARAAQTNEPKIPKLILTPISTPTPGEEEGGADVAKIDGATARLTPEERAELLKPRVLGGHGGAKGHVDRSLLQVAPEVSLRAEKPASSPSNSALLELAKKTQLRLGPEWPQLQKDFERFRKMANGSEQDRLAYTINARLEVDPVDRSKYPKLSKVFAASNRNVFALQKAQQAERQRDQEV